MSIIETTTLNEWIIEAHHLTRQDLRIHQNDAMACYDHLMNSKVLQGLEFLCAILFSSYSRLRVKLILQFLKLIT